MNTSQLLNRIFAVIGTASILSASLLLMALGVREMPGVVGWIMGGLAALAPSVILILVVMMFMQLGLIKKRSSQP